MPTRDFGNFYALTKDSPPWPLMIRAAALAPGKTALDLGAGAGRDTRYLLAQGFSVTAVDADARAIPLLEAIGFAPRLRVVHSSFEDFAFGTYDLINAEYALPFIPASAFNEVFARIQAALHPDGVFAGQFFGVHDEWNVAGTDLTFVSRADAEALLRDLDVLELTEEDHDGQTADGSPKHWHLFHILARKPR